MTRQDVVDLLKINKVIYSS